MSTAPRTLSDLSWPVRGPRVALRPFTAGDRDAVAGYRCSPEVAWWLGGPPRDGAAFDEWLADERRASQSLAVQHAGRVVGDLMLLVGDGWAQRPVVERAVGVQAELGWVLDPSAGGRGLATEAVGALLGVAFDGLGLRRVTASCFAGNTASWRLMERLGMRREHHGVRDSLHHALGWQDAYGYALLAEEWRARVRPAAYEG